MSAKVRDRVQGLLAYRRDINFMRVMQQPAPATKGLLISLGVIFVLGYLISSQVVEARFGEVDDALVPIILVGAKITHEINQGAWWRLITHSFLHGGLLHLILNGYGLLLLGTLVERLFGTRRFIIIYGVSALAGGLASTLFNAHPSVGSSGAIFGVFGAAIVFGLRHRELLPPHIARALSWGMMPWLLVSLAFGLLPMVDNSAHFGGLIAGSLTAAVMGSPLLLRDRPWLRWLQWALVGLMLALTLLAFAFAVRFAASCFDSWESWQACQQLI